MAMAATSTNPYINHKLIGDGLGEGGGGGGGALGDGLGLGDGDGGLGGGGSWQQHVEPVGAPGWQSMLMHRPFCWAHS